MTKRIMLGSMLCMALVTALFLTGCKPTTGQGVFLWNEDIDPGPGVSTVPHYINFSVQAAPNGNINSKPIGTTEELQYFHYAGAEGTMKFYDPNTGTQLKGNVKGTFYISPKDYQLLDSPENVVVSSYFGPCVETVDGQQGRTLYMVVAFLKNSLNDGENLVIVSVYENNIFYRGQLIEESDPLFRWQGLVVAGGFSFGDQGNLNNQN